MAGFPPTIAQHADSPAVTQFARDLGAYGRDFARMKPAQQLVTTRYLDATNHDLIRTSPKDARLTATRRYLDAAERLEESGDAKDAARLLVKANHAWTMPPSVRDGASPASRATTVQRMPLVGMPDPREAAMQQHLTTTFGAMAHESPTAHAGPNGQTA